MGSSSPGPESLYGSRQELEAREQLEVEQEQGQEQGQERGQEQGQEQGKEQGKVKEHGEEQEQEYLTMARCQVLELIIHLD